MRVRKVAGITDDGKYDGHPRPAEGGVQIRRIKGGIVPAVGIPPAAVADELDTLVDGRLDQCGSRIGGRVENRVHLRVAVVEHLFPQPARHMDRGGGAQAAFRVVARHSQASGHPTCVAHVRRSFVDDGLVRHAHILGDIVEREPSHQHLGEIVIAGDEGVLVVVGVVFLILRRGVKGRGNREGAGDVAQQEQVVATVVQVMVADEVFVVIQSRADLGLIGDKDVEAQGFLPLHKAGQIVAQRVMGKDQHLGAGGGQVAQVGAFIVVRQGLVSIDKGGRDGGRQFDRIAAGEGEVSLREREDTILNLYLRADQHGEASHLAESEAVAQAQGFRVSVLLFVEKVALLVKNVPAQGLHRQLGVLERQGKGSGNRSGIRKFIVRIGRHCHWRLPDVGQARAYSSRVRQVSFIYSRA